MNKVSHIPEPDCPFCLSNGKLVGEPLFENDMFYFVKGTDPALRASGMIIPRRHSETPFEMSLAEWSAFGEMLAKAQKFFSVYDPDGFTVGWNVGAVAGQKVFHTHLHIIARYKGGPNEGKGVRRIARSPALEENV